MKIIVLFCFTLNRLFLSLGILHITLIRIAISVISMATVAGKLHPKKIFLALNPAQGAVFERAPVVAGSGILRREDTSNAHLSWPT